jgi:hypothetical protein
MPHSIRRSPNCSDRMFQLNVGACELLAPISDFIGLMRIDSIIGVRASLGLKTSHGFSPYFSVSTAARAPSLFWNVVLDLWAILCSAILHGCSAAVEMFREIEMSRSFSFQSKARERFPKQFETVGNACQIIAPQVRHPPQERS